MGKTITYNLTIASMGFNGVPGWIWLGRTKTYNLEFLVGFGWERLAYNLGFLVGFDGVGLRPIILSSWFNLVR